MINPASRLPVFELAMTFAEEIDLFAESLPPYRRYIGLQVRRACLSVLLNLTEGATEVAPKEKARMYRLARRSAAECVTAMAFCQRVMKTHAAAAAELERAGLELLTQLHRLAKAHSVGVDFRRRPRKS